MSSSWFPFLVDFGFESSWLDSVTVLDPHAKRPSTDEREGYTYTVSTERIFRSACRLIADDPKDERGFLLRALILQFTRHYKEAEEDVSQAIAINPQNAKAWLLRSQIRSSLRLGKEAELDGDRARALNPAIQPIKVPEREKISRRRR